MKTEVVKIENPDGLNLILGQSHFIKTVEDLHEVLVTAVPDIKFGLAFVEASGERILRSSGTDEKLTQLAAKNELRRIAIRYHRKKDGTVFPVDIAASFLTLLMAKALID